MSYVPSMFGPGNAEMNMDGITPVPEKPTGQVGDSMNATHVTGAAGSTCTKAETRRETDRGEEGPLREQPSDFSALPGHMPPRGTCSSCEGQSWRVSQVGALSASPSAALLRRCQPRATPAGAMSALPSAAPSTRGFALRSGKLQAFLFSSPNCLISFLLGSVPSLSGKLVTSLFLIRCHFFLATCLDVLNRKSVKPVSLRRAKPSDLEGQCPGWRLTPGEGAPG